MSGEKPTVARSVNLVKDASGAPAVNLSKALEDGHVNLVKSAYEAGIRLSKRNLAGIRAHAVLVLDHSGSMHKDYLNGKVQLLVERVLGFALQIDVDSNVPVIPFDSVVRSPVEVNLNNYSGVVQNKIWQPRSMGSTNLTDALHVVRMLAEKTDTPLYVAVVTDGAPDDQLSTTKEVCALAGYPVFLKFLALRPVAYLNTLDNLGPDKRLIDNVNSKPSDNNLDLLSCTDIEFQEAMADEWDSWISEALRVGLLK